MFAQSVIATCMSQRRISLVEGFPLSRNLASTMGLRE